jgi:nitrite reductase/ring-hydroxylating ferredoxin subunit
MHLARSVGPASSVSGERGSDPIALRAPRSDAFPAFPVSWYLFASSDALRRGPVSRGLLGRRLVAHRTASGRVVVLDARCSHLGADLGKGRVIGEALQCPFHHWEYGPDGRCTHIPAQAEVPEFARQRSYPALERHGYIFLFNGPTPLFDLPFFPDCRPEDFRSARPFGTVLDCPWYMIPANAFDLQHFRSAHDRQFLGEPVIDCPAPFARRATGHFRVAGRSIQDRITRCLAGDQVTLSITDWCGNLMFTTASFRRTTSYGLVITEPLAQGGVHVRVLVFLRRSRRAIGRPLYDALRLEIRRWFIMRFLSKDAGLLNGVRYNAGGLIDCDCHLAEYFQWLAGVSHGVPRQATDETASDSTSSGQDAPGDSGAFCRKGST